MADTEEGKPSHSEYTMYLRAYAQGQIGGSYLLGSPQERTAAAAALGGFDGKAANKIKSKAAFRHAMDGLFAEEGEA